MACSESSESTVLVREVQFVCEDQSKNGVVGSPTLEESNLRQKFDDPKTDQLRKGVDSNLRGWQPKETAF